MQYKLFLILIPIFLINIVNAIFFDWKYYIKVNNLPKTWNWLNAFGHYKQLGMFKGLLTTSKEVEDLITKKSNFDWEFYVLISKLQIQNQEDAYKHYIIYGEKNNLSFCQHYKIIITLHLYNLLLAEEILTKVNNFIINNQENDYLLYINIPLNTNIQQINAHLVTIHSYKKIKLHESMTYYSNQWDNKKTLLKKIHKYVSSLSCLPPKKVKIFFSDNIGQDIGGFFFMLDYIRKENIQFDYLIKIHSKTDDYWRGILLSFLDLKINPILKKCDFYYTLPINYSDIKFISDDDMKKLEQQFMSVLNIFGLPFRNDFEYCSGTMFIVTSKIMDFFHNIDFINLARHLNYGRPEFPSLEHGLELFFGYLFTYLKFKGILSAKN